MSSSSAALRNPFDGLNVVSEHVGGYGQVRLVGPAALGLWAYRKCRRNR